MSIQPTASPAPSSLRSPQPIEEKTPLKISSQDLHPPQEQAPAAASSSAYNNSIDTLLRPESPGLSVQDVKNHQPGLLQPSSLAKNPTQPVDFKKLQKAIAANSEHYLQQAKDLGAHMNALCAGSPSPEDLAEAKELFTRLTDYAQSFWELEAILLDPALDKMSLSAPIQSRIAKMRDALPPMNQNFLAALGDYERCKTQPQVAASAQKRMGVDDLGKLPDDNEVHQDWAFMRRVYLAQTGFSKTRPDKEGNIRHYSFGVDSANLASLDGEHLALKGPVANQIRALVRDARKAGHSVMIASAYRSPAEDFKQWKKTYDQCLSDPDCRPKKSADGSYSDAAILKLAEKMRNRKAPAGYSLHTSGLAVDFSTPDPTTPKGAKERWLPTSTTEANRELWRKTPFFKWLNINAGQYGGAILNSEEWHTFFTDTEKPAPQSDMKVAQLSPPPTQS